MPDTDNQRKAFDFFLAHYQSQAVFTKAELEGATYLFSA